MRYVTNQPVTQLLEFDMSRFTQQAPLSVDDTSISDQPVQLLLNETAQILIIFNITSYPVKTESLVTQSFADARTLNVSCFNFQMSKYLQPEKDYLITNCNVQYLQSEKQHLYLFYSEFGKNQYTNIVSNFSYQAFVDVQFVKRDDYDRYFQMLLTCGKREVYSVRGLVLSRCKDDYLDARYADLNNSLVIWEWKFNQQVRPNNQTQKLDKLYIIRYEDLVGTPCGGSIQIKQLFVNPSKFADDRSTWDFIFLNANNSLCRCIIENTFAPNCDVLQLDYIYNYTQIAYTLNSKKDFILFIGSDFIVQELIINSLFYEENLGSLQSKYVVNQGARNSLTLYQMVSNDKYLVVLLEKSARATGATARTEQELFLKILQRNQVGGRNYSHYIQQISVPAGECIRLYQNPNFVDMGNLYFFYSSRRHTMRIYNIEDKYILLWYDSVISSFQQAMVVLNTTYYQCSTGETRWVTEQYQVYVSSFYREQLIVDMNNEYNYTFEENFLNINVDDYIYGSLLEYQFDAQDSINQQLNSTFDYIKQIPIQNQSSAGAPFNIDRVFFAEFEEPYPNTFRIVGVNYTSNSTLIEAVCQVEQAQFNSDNYEIKNCTVIIEYALYLTQIDNYQECGDMIFIIQYAPTRRGFICTRPFFINDGEMPFCYTLSGDFQNTTLPPLVYENYKMVDLDKYYGYLIVGLKRGQASSAAAQAIEFFFFTEQSCRHASGLLACDAQLVFEINYYHLPDLLHHRILDFDAYYFEENYLFVLLNNSQVYIFTKCETIIQSTVNKIMHLASVVHTDLKARQDTVKMFVLEDANLPSGYKLVVVGYWRNSTQNALAKEEEEEQQIKEFFVQSPFQHRLLRYYPFEQYQLNNRILHFTDRTLVYLGVSQLIDSLQLNYYLIYQPSESSPNLQAQLIELHGSQVTAAFPLMNNFMVHSICASFIETDQMQKRFVNYINYNPIFYAKDNLVEATHSFQDEMQLQFIITQQLQNLNFFQHNIQYDFTNSHIKVADAAKNQTLLLNNAKDNQLLYRGTLNFTLEQISGPIRDYDLRLESSNVFDVVSGDTPAPLPRGSGRQNSFCHLKIRDAVAVNKYFAKQVQTKQKYGVLTDILNIEQLGYNLENADLNNLIVIITHQYLVFIEKVGYAVVNYTRQMDDETYILNYYYIRDLLRKHNVTYSAFDIRIIEEYRIADIIDRFESYVLDQCKIQLYHEDQLIIYCLNDYLKNNMFVLNFHYDMGNGTITLQQKTWPIDNTELSMGQINYIQPVQFYNQPTRSFEVYLFLKTKLINDADNIIYAYGYLVPVLKLQYYQLRIIDSDIGNSTVTDSMDSVDYDIYKYSLDGGQNYLLMIILTPANFIVQLFNCTADNQFEYKQFSLIKISSLHQIILPGSAMSFIKILRFDKQDNDTLDLIVGTQESSVQMTWSHIFQAESAQFYAKTSFNKFYNCFSISGIKPFLFFTENGDIDLFILPCQKYPSNLEIVFGKPAPPVPPRSLLGPSVASVLARPCSPALLPGLAPHLASGLAPRLALSQGQDARSAALLQPLIILPPKQTRSISTRSSSSCTTCRYIRGR